MLMMSHWDPSWVAHRLIRSCTACVTVTALGNWLGQDRFPVGTSGGVAGTWEDGATLGALDGAPPDPPPASPTAAWPPPDPHAVTSARMSADSRAAPVIERPGAFRVSDR